MASQRSLLDIIIRQTKEGKGIADTDKDLKGLDKTAAGAAESSEGFSLSQIGVASAVTTAGVALLKQIPALVQTGFQYNNAKIALSAFAGGAEEAADIIDAVTEAGDGAIDNFTAVFNATKLVSLGLAETSEQAAKLTKTAITLGATMGKDATQSFEEFSLLLANSSILRLDTFGISAGKTRQRMAELAKEMPNLDRQTRFVTAALEIAEEKMDALAESGFEAVSPIDRFKTVIENTKLSVATFISEGLLPYVEIGRSVIDVTTQVVNRYQELKDKYEGVTGSAKAANFETSKTIPIMRGMEESTLGAALATADLTGELTLQEQINALVNEGMKAGSESAREYAQATILLAAATGDLNAQDAELQLQNLTLIANMEILNGLVSNNIISMGTWALIMADGEVSAAELAEAVGGDLNLAIASGVELTGELLRELDRLNGLNVTATITINTVGAGVGIPLSSGTGTGGTGAGEAGALGATGLDFTVPQGFNNDNFMVGVSSGESVLVTPPGEAPGGDANAGRGGVTIGTVVLNNQLDLNMFAESLENL